MTCQEFREIIAVIFDASLTELGSMNHHYHTCESCRNWTIEGGQGCDPELAELAREAAKIKLPELKRHLLTDPEAAK
jgi:hypothetical protein